MSLEPNAEWDLWEMQDEVLSAQADQSRVPGEQANPVRD